ncbi:MAG: serine/threonine-protein kinase [Cyanobacteria bacterium P01_A01_bin.45]
MLAGTTLQGGKYILKQEIGKGGFGITYKAAHRFLNQEIVVKTINQRLQKHPDFPKFQQQFKDEARRLATCIHPNIVRVSDFFMESGLPYMVMEYIPGDTLGEAFVLPGVPLREEIAIHYIRQIGAALQVVHQNHLLHRDVKPDNIILRRGTQEVVLIDFGIAREFNNGVRQTHTGMVSEGYSPIEQYLSHAHRSPATDIYGLASTLYALLTGRIPTSALLRDREKMPSPRELQPYLSAGVNQAIMRGMAVEAKYRPQSVVEWLKLLPAKGVSAPQGVITNMAPTIDLSNQQNLNAFPKRTTQGKVKLNKDKEESAKYIVGNNVVNNTIVNKTTGDNPKGSNHTVSNSNQTLEESTKISKKPLFSGLSPKIFIGTGVALIAATAGFGITKMIPGTESKLSEPVVENRSNDAFQETVTEEPQTEVTPSLSPSPTAEATSNTNATNAKKSTKTIRRRSYKRRNSASSNSARVNRKQKSRKVSGKNNTSAKSRSSNSNTSRTSQSTSKKASQGNNSIRKNSENPTNSRKRSTNNTRPTPVRSRSSNSSNPSSSNTSKTKRPKVKQSPSLVDKLRRYRDNRQPSSSGNKSRKLPPNSVIVPSKPVNKQPKRVKSPSVVVPVQKNNTNQSSSVIPIEPSLESSGSSQ